MRILGLILAVLPALPAAGTPAAGNDEAFQRLASLRHDAMRGGRRAEFVRFARRFLEAQPRGPRANRVRLWLGDALAERDPAAAFAAYRAAGGPRARARADLLTLRYEGAPPLRATRWIGDRPAAWPPRDAVTAVVFLGLTHPQTARVLPHLLRLRGRFASRGLRLACVATVVDDFESQRPERLASIARGLHLPFPVAIDAQRPRGPSETFRAYCGRSLPWVVVFDRYGRAAWVDGLSPTAASLARLERAVARLAAQPTLAQLAARVRDGDRAALDALRSIRTPGTVSALLELAAGPLPDGLGDPVHHVLEGLAPPEVVHAPDPLRHWRTMRNRCRYSLAADRVVEQVSAG